MKSNLNQRQVYFSDELFFLFKKTISILKENEMNYWEFCQMHKKYSFTEYHILLMDFVEFFTKQSKQRTVIELKYLISFKNSIQLLFNNVSSTTVGLYVNQYVIFSNLFTEWNRLVENLLKSTIVNFKL